MIILQYHEIFFRLTPRCPGMAAGAVSQRKSHDIVILSFCNIAKGQAKCHSVLVLQFHDTGQSNIRPVRLLIYKYYSYPNNFSNNMQLDYSTYPM